ncbi:MAG TPA: hypothetical protein VM308_02700 [Sphingomicrobium sp.]|nr:hypothetical protein [Sphingomicrobium sp.]
MSGRSFRSVFMVASCAAAALGCYMVSLRVASERAALESVETRIVLAQRDLRLLETEIGTRGRLSQLERWNAGAFALSAPGAEQFLKGSFELARLTQPDRAVQFEAPVVLAAAPAAERPQALGNDEAADEARPAQRPTLLHEASLKIETREVPARKVAELPTATVPPAAGKPVTAAKPAAPKPADEPGLAAAHPPAQKAVPGKAAETEKTGAKKSVDKPAAEAAKPVTKPVRLAKTDPLAPLPDQHSAKRKDSTTDR